MAAAMRIALTRLTDARHRLAIRRADGSVEAVELETRGHRRATPFRGAMEIAWPPADR